MRMASEEHHVFFGSANRRKSDNWGMVARLCPDCHRLSNMAVHNNREVDLLLKRRFQERFEQEHGHELFMHEFRRNYI